MNPPSDLTLMILPERYAVCRLAAEADFPEWARPSDLLALLRTRDELSVVCAERFAPPEARAERGWRVFKVQGPLDFSLVGVLAAILTPLAQAGVSVMALSTYDTDYVLVRGDMTGELIFRKASLDPLPLEKLRIASVEIVTNKNGSRVVRSNEDGALIKEVIAGLRSTATGKKPESHFSAQVYQLHLVSPDLPGLVYLAYAILDEDGRVYLAERGFEGERWVPASETVARWVRE
jgi:hypothetical protein